MHIILHKLLSFLKQRFLKAKKLENYLTMCQRLRLSVSIWCVLLQLGFGLCYLYPYETPTRELRSLNGLWDFIIPPSNDIDLGFKEAWFEKDFKTTMDSINMPVPASFNDITTNKTIRDHVGWAWYQRTFYAPDRWLQKEGYPVRVFLHFGGVHHLSIIYLNGVLVGKHKGGHLPFQLELPRTVLGTFNVLTVAVNNTLTPHTIPQGYVTYPNNTKSYPGGYRLYQHQCDYYDYSGINRPVMLFTTPANYITGVNVITDINTESQGIVKYSVTTSADSECNVKLYNKEGALVTFAYGCGGTLMVENPQLWWPAFTCNKTAGYLYTLEIYLNGESGSGPDIYRMPVGIRTVSWNNTSILINNRPIYLRGFGMHEDSDIRGRGFDYAVMTRDLNLISWIGANAIRTSHYPYAEETLNEADEKGIMVIVEAPACSLIGFGDKLYQYHEAYLLEMMSVHKNRPSVIMWSLANEPETNSERAGYYFGNLTKVAKSYDSTRPVTFVTSQNVVNDTAVPHMDMVCVNRYRAWYSDSGLTDLIVQQVMEEMREWHSKYNRPVVVTEYGAGALSGLHTLPETMWSEDYQVVTHLEHFKAFDMLRQEGTIAGELLWNFIDFNTPQEYIRPGRCVKGLFTRERQPKHAAHTVRNRYLQFANCWADCEPSLDIV
ncbi:beta-glucuronidase-like isoform X1 [Homalodisca vitripennis]|uniref:beta-glucuronidase-like isoform X1 n=2 Tax=Homalodisca vitripennis TaxID=197043 RepID=UPI001EEC3FDB|nr:beta-glucuronidase-like isoform X1 [Homalodisca vitripennis]